MSTYVTSDIHGCMDEFMELLKIINFGQDDKLILAGDYTDRGSQNLEVLRWLENCPQNVIPLRGNHDVGFVNYIDMIDTMAVQVGVELNKLDNEQLIKWYRGCLSELEDKGVYNFDRYGTLNELIEYKGITGADLHKWRELINAMPYIYEDNLNGRRCIVVHAGYIEDIKDPKLSKNYKDKEFFYIWARDDAYKCGGVQNGLIVAGHNPTNEPSLFTYARGKVFRHYDDVKDCIFYDVDCGGVYREPLSRFACIRLEDEKIFYL